MNSPLLSQSDLAELLGVTEWTIWAMRKRAELPPAVRIGRALRWRPEVIQNWVIEREKPAEEFDPVLSARAEAALAGRGLKKKANKKNKVGGKRHGRPTKKEIVEARK